MALYQWQPDVVNHMLIIARSTVENCDGARSWKLAIIVLIIALYQTLKLIFSVSLLVSTIKAYNYYYIRVHKYGTK